VHSAGWATDLISVQGWVLLTIPDFLKGSILNMSKLPIAGGTKFVPTAEPGERIPVNVVPKAGKEQTDNTWSSEEGLVSNGDSRPPQAIPAEGQETHDGWSGFITADKFSDQGSVPYKVKV
jgi:hypothetical protein